jgi:hypothetical protein
MQLQVGRFDRDSHLSIHPSIHPSTHPPFTHPSIHPSPHPSIIIIPIIIVIPIIPIIITHCTQGWPGPSPPALLWRATAGGGGRTSRSGRTQRSFQPAGSRTSRASRVTFPWRGGSGYVSQATKRTTTLYVNSRMRMTTVAREGPRALFLTCMCMPSHITPLSVCTCLTPPPPPHTHTHHNP